MGVISETDIRGEFSGRLRYIMQRKGCFEEETHVYLTDLMTRYVRLSSARDAPTINSRSTEAFGLQAMKVIDHTHELGIDLGYVFGRMRAIGETLLFGVGYLPESLTPRRYGKGGGFISRHENLHNFKIHKSPLDIHIRQAPKQRGPNLEYFIAWGSTAYKTAARAKYTERTEEDHRVAEMFENIGQEFKHYAGVVFALRQETKGIPLDPEVIFMLWHTLDDPEIITRYALDLTEVEESRIPAGSSSDKLH